MSLIPLPTNLLPHWFFPWNTPTWPGYTPFISHRELLAVDSIRQIFVWKEYAFSLLKQGIWPLWNPYNFSGQPLLANFQTAVFYPFSWFFLLFDSVTAWSLYIYSQPILAGLFMYLYLNNRFRSKLTAFFGALSLIFTSFFSTRYFWGVCIHTLLWIPLIFLISDLFKEKKLKNISTIVLMSLALTFSILGGYPQFGVYSILITIAYFIFINGFRKIWIVVFSILLSLLVCSVQLLPTFELYQNSLRDSSTSLSYFTNSLVPFKHLISILSPDYWGNPGFNNYFGGFDYSGMNGYFGVIPLIFATTASFVCFKNKFVRFWIFVGAFALLFSYPTGISLLPAILHIPILSSGGGCNNLFFFQLAGIILAAVGFDNLLKTKNIKPFLITASFYTVVLLVLIFLGRESQTSVRNTGLILIITMAFTGSLFLFSKIRAFVIMTLSLLAGVYFLYKVSPFGDLKYFYPEHPLITYVQQNSQINRVDGFGKARFGSNFATHFKVFAVSGYDSLWPKWYGQLMSSTKNGEIAQYVDRADVVLREEDTVYRQKLMNLLGIKYLFDSSDDPKGDQGPNTLRFPQDKYKLSRQIGVASVYENLNVLPRIFMANSLIVVGEKQIIPFLYSKDVDLSKTILTSQNVGVPPDMSLGKVSLINYQPNFVEIKTESVSSSLLFLSDTYFPGWKAYVNGKETQIYRADYAFRMVLVPQGVNRVIFRYEPRSFDWGIRLTIVGIITLLCLTIFQKYLNRLGHK